MKKSFILLAIFTLLISPGLIFTQSADNGYKVPAVEFRIDQAGATIAPASSSVYRRMRFDSSGLPYYLDSSGTKTYFTTGGTATLSANRFIYSGTAGVITAFGAATNGQIPIGSTGTAPVLGAITGTASQITVTLGAGTIGLSTPQSIATTSDVTFNTVTTTIGAQSAAVARTATSDGLTTGTVAAGTSFVAVTSASANNIIVLPAATPGNVVRLAVAATGYELRSSSPATIAINGGTGSAAESAIGANVLTTCTCSTATTWICMDQSSAGVVTATEPAAP